MFREKLEEFGAGFPDSFVSNLDRLIVTLHPKYKRKSAKSKAEKATKNGRDEGANGKSLEARKFPGLSLPDVKQVSSQPLSEINAISSTDEPPSRRPRPTADDFIEGDYPSKRGRYDVNEHTHRASASTSREGDYRSAQANGQTNGHTNGHFRVPPHVDDRPVLYKIYGGVVQNIRDFGAFVSLDGIKGRIEGMVHVSNIAVGRIQSPADAMKRHEHVKVKVMSIAGTKIGLSMKDVDQVTGADLS